LDIFEIITTRRSIRKFESIPVPDEIIERVLEAGRWAPSGLNNQPWRFASITEPVIKEEISTLTRYSNIIRNAQALIAVFLDNAESYNRTKDLQAVGACIQNILLEIHSLGLGAVWLGEIIKSDEQFRNILGLPDNLELMAVVAMGYSAEKPKSGKRKELGDLVILRK
jgi:nitroreductase